MDTKALQTYFENDFNGDLLKFFTCVEDGNGNIEVASFFRSRPTLFGNGSWTPEWSLCEWKRDAKFIAGFVFVAMFQQELSHQHFGADAKTIRDKMFALGLPYVPFMYSKVFIPENRVVTLLKKSDLMPYSLNETDIFLTQLNAVCPVLMDKFSAVMDEYNHFQKHLEDEIFTLNRMFIKQDTILGVSYDTQNFANYLADKFFPTLSSYFNVTYYDGYPFVGELKYWSNRRLKDGNPTGDPMQNLLFTSVLLYFILVEKSIAHVTSYESLGVFHKCSLWPLISSGPGGGFEIDALDMLKEAGLCPQPEESLYFLKTFKKVSIQMQQLVREIFNGKGQYVKDKDAYEDLKKSIDGHQKKRILRELEKEENGVVNKLLQSIKDQLAEYEK